MVKGYNTKNYGLLEKAYGLGLMLKIDLRHA